MKRKFRCSIVMATYNGELYVAEQIESVLRNMEENDELIISDDGSQDNTKAIIQSYIETDTRISTICGPQEGVIRNFENALKHVTGDIIFLCDQDDIWSDDKIDRVISAMESNVTLVLHDASVIYNEKVLYPSYMEYRGSKPGLVNNIIKNSYIGCCMAFRKEILKYILPFPKNICMHDQWIGLVNEVYGQTKYIDCKLIQYRRHKNNASSMEGYNIVKKIKNRCNMMIALFQRMQEYKR